MSIILIIGQDNDPHIQGITKELKHLNAKYVLLNNLSERDSFSVLYDRNSSGFIQMRNSVIEIEKIKSIWNYSALKVNRGAGVSKQAREFMLAEWTEGIASLWNSITARWVNHPKAISAASNRLEQLKLATRVGLRVPRTLITSNPNSFRTFYRDCRENVIAKTLHSSVGVPEGKMIFTTKMTKADLKHVEDLRIAPCMFQEYIPKKTEFRVTIVGDKLHVAEIFSQQSQKTMDDWRRYDDFRKTPYKKSKLPADVSKKLLSLMKKMNLEYGAADLIRTPTDDFVFLEINPNGRWWWIQELTGMNIARSVAEQLAK